MDKNLEIIIAFRKYLLSKIDELSVEQLNEVPGPFSNNIIWNLGHMNAVLQSLCYRASGVPMHIEDAYFFPFLPGTSPERVFDADEVVSIKRQFISLPEKLVEDLQQDIFKTYKAPEKIEKVYKIKLDSVHDAVKYTAFHDSTHMNAIIMLGKMVRGNGE